MRKQSMETEDAEEWEQSRCKFACDGHGHVLEIAGKGTLCGVVSLGNSKDQK